MRRILVVYNPRSSRFCDVEREVLSKIRTLKGYMIGKYEVAPTDVDDNAAKLSRIIKDGDLVLSAGGDATGIISSNAILKSGKDATLAVLPYGNFNDLAHTLGAKSLRDIFNATIHEEAINCLEKSAGAYERGGRSAPPVTTGGRDSVSERQFIASSFYPLEIYVDGKFFRYATCYVTIGMTAEAVELFDEPKTRKKLQKGHKSSWRSYFYLMFWYFKNRRKKQFIPDFKLNGKLQHKKTSDYAAVNGRSMCRVMKGGYDYLVPKKFRSITDRLTSFPRLFILMLKSILVRTPGIETEGDLLEFLKPSTVELQAEGEYRIFKNIKTIEIKKSKTPLNVIINPKIIIDKGL